MICKRFEEKKRLVIILFIILLIITVHIVITMFISDVASKLFRGHYELCWSHIKHRSEVVTFASSFTSVVYYVEKANL